MRRIALLLVLLSCPAPDATAQCAGGSCPRPIRPGAVYRPIGPQVAYETYHAPFSPAYVWVWTQRGWVLVRVR
jgi:hypothetical protein